MFSDAGPDLRWCGNESGTAGDPNWATMDPAAVPYPGAPGDAVIAALQHGDRRGSVWRPAEVDVSIRPGWFYHAAEDERVKTVAALTDIWFTSVGRNAKLLLNVPPTRDGLLHGTDIARLSALRSHLNAVLGEDFVAGRRVQWRVRGPTATLGEVDLGRTVSAAVIRLQEDITQGQRVARYAAYGTVDGGWRELTRGTTIGHRKLDRFSPTSVRRLRVVVEDATAPPGRLSIGLYGGEATGARNPA
jgi:alpha-L-fucosidase